MNFIVGSMTTFLDKDPSFNMVSMNKDTALPVDFYTYHASIPDANANDKPEWKIIYDYKEIFGLKTLAPGEFLKASEKILWNATAGAEYVKFRYVGGPL